MGTASRAVLPGQPPEDSTRSGWIAEAGGTSLRDTRFSRHHGAVNGRMPCAPQGTTRPARPYHLTPEAPRGALPCLKTRATILPATRCPSPTSGGDPIDTRRLGRGASGPQGRRPLRPGLRPGRGAPGLWAAPPICDLARNGPSQERSPLRCSGMPASFKDAAALGAALGPKAGEYGRLVWSGDRAGKANRQARVSRMPGDPHRTLGSGARIRT